MTLLACHTRIVRLPTTVSVLIQSWETAIGGTDMSDTSFNNCSINMKSLTRRHQAIPEPMLTSHQWGSLAFTWEQFHIECLGNALHNDFKNHTFKIIGICPMVQWVNTTQSVMMHLLIISMIRHHAYESCSKIYHCTLAWMEHLPLRWRHNGRDGVSNHQPHDCLLDSLFGLRSKKTSTSRVTGLCVGNSPVTGEFPAQKASNAENVSVWWRLHANDNHNEMELCRQLYPGINHFKEMTQINQKR